jgi:hypothetical protein
MKSLALMEAAAVSERKPKLLDRVRSDLRVKHYSTRTEKAYIDWIRRFILFHGKRHPNEMGERESAPFSRILQWIDMSPRLRRIKRSARCFSSISKYYN